MPSEKDINEQRKELVEKARKLSGKIRDRVEEKCNIEPLKEENGETSQRSKEVLGKAHLLNLIADKLISSSKTIEISDAMTKEKFDARAEKAQLFLDKIDLLKAKIRESVGTPAVKALEFDIEELCNGTKALQNRIAEMEQASELSDKMLEVIGEELTASRESYIKLEERSYELEETAVEHQKERDEKVEELKTAKEDTYREVLEIQEKRIIEIKEKRASEIQELLGSIREKETRISDLITKNEQLIYQLTWKKDELLAERALLQEDNKELTSNLDEQTELAFSRGEEIEYLTRTLNRSNKEIEKLKIERTNLNRSMADMEKDYEEMLDDRETIINEQEESLLDLKYRRTHLTEGRKANWEVIKNAMSFVADMQKQIRDMREQTEDALVSQRAKDAGKIEIDMLRRENAKLKVAIEKKEEDLRSRSGRRRILRVQLPKI